MTLFASSYPFLNILWDLLIFFAWVIFIWIAITVLIDVFRRHDISGWSKAFWTIFIVILNTAAGVSAIANNKIRAAQALGATRGQIFFHVALPATVPYILTGMRLAMANSFTTIVAAELIAANEGLGKMLWDGRMFMLVDDIFVSLVSLGLLGFAVDRMFRWSIYTFAGKYSPAT